MRIAVFVYVIMFVTWLTYTPLAHASGVTNKYIVQIDADTYDAANALAIQVGTTDFEFGTVEATTSQVIDLDDLNPFVVDIPPTFLHQDDLEWDDADNTIKITYKSLKGDGTGSASQYNRILYFQKGNQAIDTGDSGNPCLTLTTTPTECWDAMDYYGGVQAWMAADDSNRNSGPTVEYIDTSGVYQGIQISTTSDGNEDTITIKINLENIIGAVDGETVYGSKRTVSDGANVLTYYDIGIGMLFWPDDSTISKTIVFDHFQLLEDTAQTWIVQKINQYTLARHINFQYIQAEADALTNNGLNRLVVLQVVLQQGHIITGSDPVRVAIKRECAADDSSPACYQSIVTSDCDTLSTSQELLTPPTCLTTLPICDAAMQTLEVLDPSKDDGSTMQQTVVNYAVPVPHWFDSDAMSDKLQISVSVETCKEDDTTSGICASGELALLSLLNFESNIAPTHTCRNAVTQTFSPIDHVVLDVFGKKTGDTLTLLDSCAGTNPCAVQPLFQDDAGLEQPTFSTIQAVLFMAIRPAHTAAASEFFSFTDDYGKLDEVYITHKNQDSTYDLSTVVAPTRTIDATGRVTLTLHDSLLTQCPLEIEGLEISSKTCITTHDYGHSGALTRPVSSGQFVYELQYKGSFVITTAQIQAGSMSIKVASNAQFWLYVPVGYTVSDAAASPDPDRIDDTHATVNIWTADADVTYNKYLITGVEDLKLVDTDSNEHTVDVVSDTACTSHAESDRTFLSLWYNVEVESLNAFYVESLAQVPQTSHTSFYWIVPTYNWVQSVLGLIDQSMLFMAWSVYDSSSDTSTPTSSSRRLLQFDTDESNEVEATNEGNEDNEEYDKNERHTSKFADPALLHRIALARTLEDVSDLCGNIAQRPMPTEMPSWRKAIVESLDCENISDVCDAVYTCNSTEACVHVLTDVAIHMNIDMTMAASAASAASTLSPSLPMLHTSFTDSTNTNASMKFSQEYHETSAAFDSTSPMIPMTTPTPQSHHSHRTLYKNVSAVFYNADQCKIATDTARQEDVHVLAVKFDKSVLAPLEFQVFHTTGEVTCNLAAITQKLSHMRLIHIFADEAVFVSNKFISKVPIPTLNPPQAPTHKYSSYFMQPRHTLSWLHKELPYDAARNPIRVELSCGGAVYREQIGTPVPRLQKRGIAPHIAKMNRRPLRIIDKVHRPFPRKS